MKPIATTNNVVLRRVDDLGHGGMEALNFPTPHLEKSRVGIVESVCSHLDYGGYEFHKSQGGHTLSAREQKEAAAISKRSPYYDVPIEVKEGDMVMFRYLSNIDYDRLLPDGRLLVRYDNLTARVDAEGLYPLNGGILVRMGEADRSTDYLWNAARDNEQEKGVGTVVAEGCLVNSYLLFAGFKDPDISLLGRTVFFDQRTAIPLEHDSHKLLRYEDSRWVYRLTRRQQINGYI